MTKQEINNIEEMSNKLVEYVHAAAKNDKDYELQCMGVAVKMVLASFSFDANNGKGVILSSEQIINKCEELWKK